MRARRRPSADSTQALWVGTSARTLACEYRYAKLIDTALDDNGQIDGSYFVVTFSYNFAGETYIDQYDSPVSYEPGQSFDIYVNPADPQENSRSWTRPISLGRILGWGLGIAAGLFIVYLSNRYGWEE